MNKMKEVVDKVLLVAIGEEFNIILDGEELIAGTVELDEIKEYLQENCKVKF